MLQLTPENGAVAVGFTLDAVQKYGRTVPGGRDHGSEAPIELFRLYLQLGGERGQDARVTARREQGVQELLAFGDVDHWWGGVGETGCRHLGPEGIRIRLGLQQRLPTIGSNCTSDRLRDLGIELLPFAVSCSEAEGRSDLPDSLRGSDSHLPGGLLGQSLNLLDDKVLAFNGSPLPLCPRQTCSSTGQQRNASHYRTDKYTTIDTHTSP